MSQDKKPNYVAEAGAPETEITPAMIDAGVSALWEDWSLQAAGEPEALVVAVYKAMAAASFSAPAPAASSVRRVLPERGQNHIQRKHASSRR